MASNWMSFANDLKCVKHFVEKECAWRLCLKNDRCRCYYAISTESTYFHPDPEDDDGGDDANSMLCQLTVLRQGQDNVLFLTVNGKTVGQFRCGVMKKRKCSVLDLGEFYLFSSSGPFLRSERKLVSSPVPLKETVESRFLEPGFLYEHCSLVTPREADAAVIGGAGDNRATRLGGVCAWAVFIGDEVSIYCYVINFDLFAACCDRTRFPSMARLYAESVRCDSLTCKFCRDHGKHVDVAGKFFGCVPDCGSCFCYVPCRSPVAMVSDRSSMPFFTQSDGGASLINKVVSLAPIGLDVSRHIGVLDEQGKELEVKRDAWTLVKLEPELSRLIILCCPVLKRLAVPME